METNLHIRVLSNKLTPELSRYLDISRSELEYAWDLEVPQADGDTSFHSQLRGRKLSCVRLDRGRYSTHFANAHSANDG